MIGQLAVRLQVDVSAKFIVASGVVLLVIDFSCCYRLPWVVDQLSTVLYIFVSLGLRDQKNIYVCSMYSCVSSLLDISPIPLYREVKTTV